MPLMSMTRMHKSFPPTFANGFSRRATKERKENYETDTVHHDTLRREQLKKKQTQEVIFSSNEDNVIKRQRTPTDDDDDVKHEHYNNEFSGEIPVEKAVEINHDSQIHENDVRSKDVTSWWAFRPRSRDLNSRGRRTTFSLEMVDLWESDSEEPEAAQDNAVGFDKINGVLINPRKTFDISELRRHRERHMPPITAWEVSKAPRNKKHSRHSERIVHTLEHGAEASNANDTQHRKGCIDSRKDVDRKQTVKSEKVEILCSDVSRKPEPQRKSVAERLLDIKLKNGIKHKQKQSETDSQSHMNLYNPHNYQQKTKESPSHESNNKMASSLKQTTPALKVKPRVKMAPGMEYMFPAQNPVSHGNIVNKCVQSVADLHSHKMTDISQAEQTFPPASQKRRVKFNKVVSVREGENNKLDFLRTSKNSAQMFKQKYLLGIPNRVIEESRPTTPTPELTHCVQLAY